MWQSGRSLKLKSYISAPITAHLVAWSLAAALAIGLSATGAFYWGYDYGLKSVGASAGEVKQLRISVKEQQQSLDQLKSGFATLKQDRDIAVQTAQKLQDDNKNQLASVADMQEQIMLYQRLLGAKGATNALSIDNVSIKKTAENKYQYRLLLTQVTNNQTEIMGKVSIRVLGAAKNQAIDVAPADFRFQYFNSVTGSIILPAGFQADSVEITLQALGKKATRIQKKFKWEVAT